MEKIHFSISRACQHAQTGLDSPNCVIGKSKEFRYINCEALTLRKLLHAALKYTMLYDQGLKF